MKETQTDFLLSPTQGRVGLGHLLLPSEERVGAGQQDRLQAVFRRPGEPGEGVDVLQAAAARRERIRPQKQTGELRNV